MKFLIVLAVALAAVLADSYEPIPILKSSFESAANGAYQVAYATGNGITAGFNGVVKNPNSEHPAAEVTGSYQYTAPDGSPVNVQYIANENGYQPQGNVLPVGPAIPDAILRSLKYNAEHPAPVEKKFYVSHPPHHPGYYTNEC